MRSTSRLRKRAKGKIISPNSNISISDLGELLIQLSPETNSEKLKEALKRIIKAIDSYRRSFSEDLENGRFQRTGKNAAYAALDRFERKVSALSGEDLFQESNSLPILAMQMLSREYGPRGKLLRDPSDVRASACNAMKKIAAAKDDPPDNERIYLVYVIGVELSKLDIRLSLSESDERMTGQRGGAAWARVVNQALAIAGFQGTSISKKELKKAKNLMAELG